MSKIHTLKLKLDQWECDYTYLNTPEDRMDDLVCAEVVKKLLGYKPKRIRIDVYDKNPKRKNTIKIEIVECYDKGLYYNDIREKIFTPLHSLALKYIKRHKLEGNYAIIREDKV